MNDIKQQGKVIYSPVHVFQHPDTSAQVTLVGTLHVGHRHYYERLQEVLDELVARGATIHAESIGTPSQDELQALSRRWQRTVNRLSGNIASITELTMAVGLVYQGECIEPREAWENHDLKKIEVARILGHAFVLLQYTVTKAMAYTLRKQTPEQYRARVLRQIPEKDDTANMAKLPSALKQATARRDEVALTAVDDHFNRHPGKPLGLLWGRGHIPALAEGLKARGYITISEEWVAAIEERFLELASVALQTAADANAQR